MALRPQHVYKRLNRARLDSNGLALHLPEILEGYRGIKAAHEEWRAGRSPAELASASQRFLDLLSMIFLVPPKALSLLDKPRPHSRDETGRLRGELFGSCASQGNIRVYLRTAAREQPTAFKTYFNTLVHEWVHHYDFEALGDTIHCAGFYERVNAVYRPCVGSKAEPRQEELF